MWNKGKGGKEGKARAQREKKGGREVGRGKRNIKPFFLKKKPKLDLISSLNQ